MSPFDRSGQGGGAKISRPAEGHEPRGAGLVHRREFDFRLSSPFWRIWHQGGAQDQHIHNLLEMAAGIDGVSVATAKRDLLGIPSGDSAPAAPRVTTNALCTAAFTRRCPLCDDYSIPCGGGVLLTFSPRVRATPPGPPLNGSPDKRYSTLLVGRRHWVLCRTR